MFGFASSRWGGRDDGAGSWLLAEPSGPSGLCLCQLQAASCQPARRPVNLETAAGRAVEAAIDAGAADAEAWAEETVSRHVRVYEGAVESLSDAGGRGIGLRAFEDGRAGYAYGTDLSDEGVAELARAARGAAEVVDADEFGGLPEEFGASTVQGLHSPALAGWSTERKVELALAVERAARAREGVTQVETVVYSDAEARVAIANSRDFSAAYEATQAWAYASAFAGEGADLMTGLGVGLGRDPDGLAPPAIGDGAARRALALGGARAPETRHCPVIMDTFVAASFVGFIGGMLSAAAGPRGRPPVSGVGGGGGGGPGLPPPRRGA